MEWYEWIFTVLGTVASGIIVAFFVKKMKLNIKIEKKGPHAEGDYIIYNYEDKDVIFEEYGMRTSRKLIVISKKKKYYPYTLILFRIKELFFTYRINKEINQKIKPG